MYTAVTLPCEAGSSIVRVGRLSASCFCFGCIDLICVFVFFFFNDTATTEIYTLSLHDALPISPLDGRNSGQGDPDLIILGSWLAALGWRHRPWHEERGQERPHGHDDPRQPVEIGRAHV